MNERITGIDNFLMPREGLQVQAYSFASDPVNFFKAIKENKQAGDQYALIAIDLVDRLVDRVKDDTIPTSSDHLNQLIRYGRCTYEGDSALFSLLKEAGYVRADIVKALTIGNDEVPAAVRMARNISLQALDSIYGTD